MELGNNQFGVEFVFLELVHNGQDIECCRDSLALLWVHSPTLDGNLIFHLRLENRARSWQSLSCRLRGRCCLLASAAQGNPNDHDEGREDEHDIAGVPAVLLAEADTVPIGIHLPLTISLCDLSESKVRDYVVASVIAITGPNPSVGFAGEPDAHGPGFPGIRVVDAGAEHRTLQRHVDFAEDRQLILVARTVCWLEYGRGYRERTVDSDFSAARIMRQIDGRWPGDRVRLR